MSEGILPINFQIVEEVIEGYLPMLDVMLEMDNQFN
jgi:hypothetical protein